MLPFVCNYLGVHYSVYLCLPIHLYLVSKRDEYSGEEMMNDHSDDEKQCLRVSYASNRGFSFSVDGDQ